MGFPYFCECTELTASVKQGLRSSRRFDPHIVEQCSPEKHRSFLDCIYRGRREFDRCALAVRAQSQMQRPCCYCGEDLSRSSTSREMAVADGGMYLKCDFLAVSAPSTVAFIHIRKLFITLMYHVVRSS